MAADNKRRWYGIAGIGYHYVNIEPYIVYKGERFDIHEIEDSMWDRYCDSYPNGSYEGFASYMKLNQDMVYGMLDGLIEDRERAAG